MGTENSQEAINSQEKTVIELNDRDKRVKKVCETIWGWGFVLCIVLFIIAFSIIEFTHRNYMGFVAVFFVADMVGLPILFICYWKLVRKEPVPDWFCGDDNSSWNNNPTTGNSIIFPDNQHDHNPPMNHIFHAHTSHGGSYTESNAHRYFVQNTSHNYSHNKEYHR